MPTITIKNATIDGVAFIEVDSTKSFKHKKSAQAAPPGTITWKINNRVNQAFTVYVLDFKGLNGGTPFSAGVPAGIPVNANANTQIQSVPDGDEDTYQYRVAVLTSGAAPITIQVEDPELIIDP
jgi:hypothetical protein